MDLELTLPKSLLRAKLGHIFAICKRVLLPDVSDLGGTVRIAAAIAVAGAGGQVALAVGEIVGLGS